MNYYYRYHFYAIQDGKKIEFYVCANNIYLLGLFKSKQTIF